MTAFEKRKISLLEEVQTQSQRRWIHSTSSRKLMIMHIG